MEIFAPAPYRRGHDHRSRHVCCHNLNIQLLYGLIVLGHDRRRVIHFEVTPNPTQIWLARQMTEAFPCF
jgi:hypothetical protein